MIINHNMNAQNAHRLMSTNTAASGKSMEKLSSGLRINRAGDDAAGLAISEKMRGQIRGLDQASRNSQDGISMIQTAEGALNETHSILQRMRELAVQASNDTNTANDRGEIQKEVNQLSSEINRIAGTTEFNKQVLMDGSKSASQVTGATVSITKAGANATQQSIEYTFTSCVNVANALGGCAACTIEFNGVQVLDFGCANAPACTTLTGSVNELANLMNTALSGKFTVTASGDKLTITAVAGGTCDGKLTCTVGFEAVDACTSGALLAGGTVTRTVTSQGTDATCQIQKISFSNETIEEGLKVTIGNKTVALWDSNAGTYANATDAKQALGADALLDISCAGGVTICAIDLVDDLAACTDTFIAADVALTICENETTGDDNILVITAASAGATKAAQTVASLTASEGTASGSDNGLTLQIGANADQTFKVSFSEMTAKAIKVSGQSAGSELITSTNKTASFTTTANVSKNGATTEYALDLSNSTKATAAIDAIDDAIQSVSAERSKLGAYQNRLEHTISNLSTSSENLTAAESRIRDVDMAKEMMTFSKNNILSQAAQAMLAQANQQPQGVLQLLR